MSHTAKTIKDALSNPQSSDIEKLKHHLKRFLLENSPFKTAILHEPYGADSRFAISLKETDSAAGKTITMHFKPIPHAQKPWERFRLIDQRVGFTNIAKGNTGRVRMQPFVTSAIPETATAADIIATGAPR